MLRVAIGMSLLISALTPAVPAPTELPHNPYGAHMWSAHNVDQMEEQLTWVRHLVGEWGYVKIGFADITAETKGPQKQWAWFVRRCYELHLVPVCRLGGLYRDGGWVKPKADPDGRYESMARAVKAVVAGLPRSDACPLYIEIWNEPNLAHEWSGRPNIAEYGRFLVDCAAAIRSIGDKRITILNGAFALSASSAEEMFTAVPESLHAFDVWASHPYPQNHPPEYNLHDNTADNPDFAIDSYLRELEVLRRFGRDVPVMIVETGYPLGNDLFTQSEGFPIIDEYNRAKYIMRAFRDYYPTYPELLAVLPFIFCEGGWEVFNWVSTDSKTDERGLPTSAHLQYHYVRKLAKPTDSTGAVSGHAAEETLGVRIEGAKLRLEPGGLSATTDRNGVYFFPTVQPGRYSLTASAEGHKKTPGRRITVSAGANTVADVALAAIGRGGIAGAVLDGMTGEAVEGATITVSPGGARAESAAAGKYLIGDLVPVRYTLAATAQGYTTHEVRGLGVAADKLSPCNFRVAPQRLMPGDNMLGNWSMELGAGEGETGGIALRWETLGGGLSAAVSDQTARTGYLAQAIRARSQHDVVRQITTYNVIDAGVEYQVEVWICCKDLRTSGAGQGAWVDFDFTDNAGAVLARVGTGQRVTGTSGWTATRLRSTAPEGSRRLSVNLNVGAIDGVAYFDDAYLAEGERQ